MRIHLRLIALWLLLPAVTVPAQQAPLGPAARIADGVLLYRLGDQSLLNPPGPIAVQALRLDPRAITLEIALPGGVDSPPETVAAMAARRPGAIAAINAGFFSLGTGRPTAFLKIDGQLVSGSRRPRGAVGILNGPDLTTLIFDRVAVTRRGSGAPVYKPLLGTSPEDWRRAPYAVGGAGLLMLGGGELTDWSDERIAARFDTTRHPRTLIGTGAQGEIWLVTVDGRNPSLSLGMSFAELQRLSKRLGLRSTLNLDGGGSTTMWVDGQVVNHPSDPGGARKVSDAIVVLPRPR